MAIALLGVLWPLMFLAVEFFALLAATYYFQ